MKTIVIIDDDPGVLDIFRLILEKAGYRVCLYSNAKAVLEKNYEYPDLFLLDRQLSGVDGLDVCKHLKTQKDTKSTPVIIISATPGLARLAENASADDYLEKPFSVKELLAMIAKYLPS